MIENCRLWSNPGSGVALAESQQVQVTGCWFADNGRHISLRNIAGRSNHRSHGTEIASNRFGQVRGDAAIITGIGTWPDGDDARDQVALVIRDNIWDIGEAAVAKLFGRVHGDLESLAVPGPASRGGVAAVALERELIPTRLRRIQRELPGIAELLTTADPGDELVLRVNGRSAIEDGAGGWRALCYDLAGGRVTVGADDAGLRRDLTQRVPGYPVSEAIPLRVRIGEAGIELLAVGVDAR